MYKSLIIIIIIAELFSLTYVPRRYYKSGSDLTLDVGPFTKALEVGTVLHYFSVLFLSQSFSL